MTDQAVFEEYTGFTDKEVKSLCERFDMDFSQTNNWYDGYPDIVQMLGGSHVKVNTLSFQNDMRTFKTKPYVQKPALVIELKYNKSVSTAIRQIKDRHFAQALEGYTGEILLIGINYDKNDKSKSHSCIIEKFHI